MCRDLCSRQSSQSYHLPGAVCSQQPADEGVELVALTLQGRELRQVVKFTCSSKWKQPGLKGAEIPLPRWPSCLLHLIDSGS